MGRRFHPLIVAVAILAQAVVTGFAPPVDKPMRAATEAVRTDNGVTRRFTSARRIVFRRNGTGYRAEILIEASEPTGPDDDPAAMARAGFAHIAGRTILVELDAKGQVVAVADHAVVWKAMLDGFTAQAPTGTTDLDRKRAGRVRAIVAALAGMPVDRQRLVIASLVAPLIAADLAAEGASPPRTVRLPAISPYGTAQLDGIRAARMMQGQLEVTVTAQGGVSVQDPSGTASGTVSLETVRRIDPLTGLVTHSIETVRTLAPDGSVAAERVTTTRFE